MTKSEVVEAFVRGELDRRGFIAKLTALGVSGAAAMTYAGTLGQSAAAAPVQGGFVTRAFMQDAEYGPAVPIEDIQEAVEAVVETVEAAVASIADLLANFDVADFVENGLDEGDFAVIEDIQTQINEQIAALTAFLGTLGGARRSSGVAAFGGTLFSARIQLGGTLMDQLAAVADDLNQSAGMYAAILPSAETAEDRDMLTQIAIVAGRHAALVSHMAGMDPTPSAFEQPIDPASVS